jgi:histidinol dehydrogenase
MRISRFEWDGDDPELVASEIRDLAPPLEEVSDAVREIVRAVRERGDEVVLELTALHDATDAPPQSLRVDPEEVERAANSMDPGLRAALDTAAHNIRLVSEAELRQEFETVELPQGHSVQVRNVPVRAAGVYAPGGRAVYPSSVLMCCVPARVAGVARLAVASPPGPDGSLDPVVLAACAVAEADEVYAMGGAQAVAAFALGTESVPRVDVIAGPGSRYVQEAKVQLGAEVGTDEIAGPTELVVCFDREEELEWVALDLCAQAEHGDDGLLVAIAPWVELLERLAERVEALAAERPSVQDPPLALATAPDSRTAVALAEALAPEHLELMTKDASLLAPWIGSAGAVFVGAHGGAAFGDYAAGSSHVLPTGGAARFSGPLGPGTFRSRTVLVHIDEAASAALAPQVDTIARAEGFPVHGESARARASDDNSATDQNG